MEDDLESLPMHPINNIRGASSDLLAGKRIVLGVSGSIAAIKCVELARELTRHGAHVHAVMSKAAQGIITPASLEFGTGNPVVTELTGAVEHVAMLGDVPERADLLLIAPATANILAKFAGGMYGGVGLVSGGRGGISIGSILVLNRDERFSQRKEKRFWKWR